MLLSIQQLFCGLVEEHPCTSEFLQAACMQFPTSWRTSWIAFIQYKNYCYITSSSCCRTFSNWYKGSICVILGEGISELNTIKNIVYNYGMIIINYPFYSSCLVVFQIVTKQSWYESLFNQPCFCASSEARCLIPIPNNAWTTADHVGVTFFSHSWSIWVRQSPRDEQSTLIALSWDNLIPNWRPKFIHSLTSCSSLTRSASSAAADAKIRITIWSKELHI